MSDRLLRLASALRKPSEIAAQAGEEVIEVSSPASTAAVIYEKVRTAIDNKEEHLLRRNAILRILKRFLGSDMPLEAMAENLLQELVWAKYLPNREVPTAFVNELRPLITKYGPLFQAADESSQRDRAFEWVLDIISAEIEYAIAPPYGDEALVSYMYEELRERIQWDQKLPFSDQDKDLALYIAIHQNLLKSDGATLRFRVMTLFYPDWPGRSTPARIKDVSHHLESIIDAIDGRIQHPVTAKLVVLVRRKAGIFRVIGKMLNDKAADLPALLADPEKLDREVATTLKKETKRFRVRLRRLVVRSVIFLFITKMFLALLLEVPYDLLIVKEAHFFPLFVNILFHPFFLAFIALTISIPEKRNSTDYQGVVRALVVGADHDLLNIRVKRESFGAWSRIFMIVYTLTFFVTYGAIAGGLKSLHFSWLSVSLFLFFFSLVTFFGVKIRFSVRDIVISDRRSGLLGTMFDILLLPIVRAGRWLSTRVAKINVFIYFFDFIIEAPLKVAVRFIESWTAFIREKKEEI